MARPKGKRDNILNSASDVFNNKGFHLANINDIAEHAGIGKGTVYEYFTSKNELFIEVVKQNTNQYVETIREVTNEKQKFREKFTAFSDTHRAFIKANFEATGGFLGTPGSLALAIDNREEVMKILLDAREQVITIIMDILNTGLAEGTIKPMPADVLKYTSDVVFDMINRNTARVCQFSLDETQIRNEEIQLLDILLNGIGS
ncbi:MAG TPA: hypothetical protein DCS67_08985 [Clostridiales bacterium UBA8960]|nr:hypothetical protein [Clostridiales bacterium UBA8960]